MRQKRLAAPCRRRRGRGSSPSCCSQQVHFSWNNNNESKGICSYYQFIVARRHFATYNRLLFLSITNTQHACLSHSAHNRHDARCRDDRFCSGLLVVCYDVTIVDDYILTVFFGQTCRCCACYHARLESILYQ
jgi:hypothetical protein